MKAFGRRLEIVENHKSPNPPIPGQELQENSMTQVEMSCGTSTIPDLCHYYERRKGPFLNLSDLPLAEAQRMLNSIKAESSAMAAQRFDGYLERRRELEQLARRLFIAKGGRPKRAVPHTMVVGPCQWLETWYVEPASVCLPLSAFTPNTLSFTYGDIFPTFSPRVTDDREYRRTVYTLEEILGIIEKYGLPQDWNVDGAFGPERYVEVQVWDDSPLQNLQESYSIARGRRRCLDCV